MRIGMLSLLAASLVAGGCNRTDPAPVGTSRLVEGTPAAGRTAAVAPVADPTATTPALAGPATAAPVVAATWREVTIPAGTSLPIILDTGVSSDSSRVEEPVHAHLARPVSVGGSPVLPRGSRLSGVVTEARRAAKVKGRARVAVRFDTLVPEGVDEHYSIQTTSVGRTARATKKNDALKIAAPAAGGAALGALIGGKKGALIGTAAGGGAGAAVVLSTRGEEARLSKGAPITLRLTQPLTIKIRG